MLYTSLHSSAFGRFTLVRFCVLHTRPLLGVAHKDSIIRCMLIKNLVYLIIPLSFRMFQRLSHRGKAGRYLVFDGQTCGTFIGGIQSGCGILQSFDDRDTCGIL